MRFPKIAIKSYCLVPFGLALLGAFIISLKVQVQYFSHAKLNVVFVFLISIVYLYKKTVYFSREFLFYAAFFIYMFASLLWTENVMLALNTLIPSVCFILIIFFYHQILDERNYVYVIYGVMLGTLMGSLVYIMRTGFPFRYPDWFSYNAIASIFISGFLFSMLFTSISHRLIFGIGMAALFLMLSISTTSIKSNLGLVLGVAAASIFYFRLSFIKIVKHRSFLIGAIFLSVIVVSVFQYPPVLRATERGYERIRLGIEVIKTQQDLPGYGGMAKRKEWIRYAIHGWFGNPVFGYGPEALRNEIGTTSHTTYADLLYNTGIIGTLLFHLVFFSLFARLFLSSRRRHLDIKFGVFSGLVCYLFISLSGTMHYDAYLAMFLGVGVPLLSRVVANRERERLNVVANS